MAGKKKKKNAMTLLAMAAVLVLLLVGYVAVTKSKERKAEEEAQQEAEDTTIGLLAIEAGQIAAIGVEGEQYSYTLKLADTGWVLAGDEEFPLDTTVPDAMIELLADFSATRLVLENAADLSEYGLTEPTVRVRIELKDGTAREIRMGDKSTADGGYYTCIDSSSDVYLVEESNQTMFYLTEEDLLLLATIPTFSSSYVTGFKIVSDIYPSFTITDSPADEVDLTARNIYPSSLYDVYAEPVHIDSTSFAEIMESYTTAAFGELVSYEEAALAEAGLAEPKTAMTIWYQDSTTGEPGEFTLYVGAMDEAGENYHVRLEGSNQVFLMEKEIVEAMLTPDTFYAISKYTQMVNITMVGEVAVAYIDPATEAASSRCFEMTHETETSESGAVTTTDFFTVDGKELTTDEEADAFRDIYQLLIGIKLTAPLEEDAVLKDASILDITFKADETLDIMRTVRYVPLEGAEALCAIEVDGKALFTVERTTVEEVVSALTQYQP